MLATRTAEERARCAFDLIANVRGMSNAELGRRASLSTSTVESRRKGRTLMTIGDVETFARVLSVPVELFHSSERDIHLWFASEWAARDSNPEPADSLFLALAIPPISLLKNNENATRRNAVTSGQFPYAEPVAA